jgi:hypothetical protein
MHGEYNDAVPRRSTLALGAMSKLHSSRGVALGMTALALCGCVSTRPQNRIPVKTVPVCEVQKDPLSYDRMLLRLTGFVDRDFETFWIEDADCAGPTPLWIEYGGPKPADGPDWHGPLKNPPNRHDSLWVEGIETPLEADAQFHRFDSMTKSLKRGRKVRATLIGRVFASGTYKDEKGEEQEIGFGPYGMYSLFVIQQVETVSRE